MTPSKSSPTSGRVRPPISLALVTLTVALTACSTAGIPGVRQVQNAVQSMSTSSGDLRLVQDGVGRLILPGQTRNLGGVTVNLQNNGAANLALQPTGSSGPVQVTGQVQSKTPDSVAIQVTGVNNQPASGTVEFAYGQDNTLRNLQGNGQWNGQPFSLAFNHTVTAQNPTGQQPLNQANPSPTASQSPDQSTPSPTVQSPSPTPNQGPLLSLSQQGQGSYQVGNQVNQSIVTASLFQTDAQTADLYLNTREGNQVRLSGNITSNTANSLTLRLQGTGSGTVYVDYTPDGNISNISGSGTLNSQTFSVQFAPQLAQQPDPGSGVPITQQPAPTTNSSPPVTGLW